MNFSMQSTHAPPSSHDLERTADLLKTIAHPARLLMLIQLITEDRTVASLAELAQIPPHAASSHLRLMQRQGVVKGIRRGKNVCYRITSPEALQLINFIAKCRAP